MHLKTVRFLVALLQSRAQVHLLLSPLLQLPACLRLRRMSVFTQKMNPVTGKSEWELQREDYDFQQEVARSAYADMLHDRERNEMYYAALKEAIKKMQSSGKKAKVLDIGTGTGLLSMMAVECGADSVVACEAFAPMANCARDVINRNNLGDRIQLILKRSTDITVGPDGDMDSKANILVTEIFDTELIGEGAIRTFRHAHQVLLEKDCIVIPSAATVYAQVVQSELAVRWNRLLPVRVSGHDDVITPPEIWSCPGAAAVHDIQLSQVTCDSFKPLTKPLPVVRFDWCGKTELPYAHTAVKDALALCEGTIQAIFMWWDLTMDTEGKIILSCAPYWAHPDPDRMQWRDHWMQAVYYLPRETEVQMGEGITLVTSHDEYSFWFSVEKGRSSISASADVTAKRPVCACGAHVAFSRTRLGMLNDETRNEKYVAVLKKCITSESVCLCLSDGALLSLVAARLGAKMVYAVESNNIVRRVLESYIKHNKLEDKVMLFDNKLEDLKVEDLGGKITVVLGEPFFFTTLLPWHGLHFWYWKTSISHLLASPVSTLPCGATIWAIGVEYKDLWKIHAPLHNVEGFNMDIFDQLIESASDICDPPVEPHPLWEYPCRALTQPVQVLAFNFTKLPSDNVVENCGSFLFEGSGTCNGVALWVNWNLDDNPKNVISTGPTLTPQVDKQISWDMHSRQGVYFFKIPSEVTTGQSQYLKYEVQFLPASGVLNFSFDVEHGSS